MAIFTKSTSMEHIKKKIVFQTLLSKMHLQHIANYLYKNIIFQEPYKDTAQLKFYVTTLKDSLNNILILHRKWDPFKVNEYTKSAQFTAEYIANALELQKPVKQIFSLFKQCLKKIKMSKVLKLLCSGRLQGVEMAKTETLKFGKISLHVFSSKVDYAEARASTGFWYFRG